MENDEEEVVVDDTIETPAEDPIEEDTIDWKAKFEESEGRRKRAEKKAERAAQTEEKPPSKSDGLDYGAKAFATAHDLKIKGPKEFEFVESELKKSGEELESLLENDYFKTRLANFRALNKTSEAIPTGKRSGVGAIDSVEYWMEKPFEEVPRDMKAKVVQAKLDKENNKGKFYNS